MWRARLDLNPLGASDPDTAAWLTALIWPEHDDRRGRLLAALSVAANMSIRIDRADLRDGLAAPLADVPSRAVPLKVARLRPTPVGVTGTVDFTKRAGDVRFDTEARRARRDQARD